MNSFKPVIISAIIAIISMHLMICSAIDTSNSHQEKVIEVNINVPELQLDNDILEQIIEYDVYPVFEELVSDKTIYLISGFDEDKTTIWFFLKAITPLELAPFKIEEKDNGYTSTEIIGFIKYKNIYIFLKDSYRSQIEAISPNPMHFSLKTIYYRGAPFEYDPWNRIYYIMNDTVRRLGRGDLNANREYMKKILNAME